MRKLIFILLFSVAFSSIAAAQKKYLYQDSTLKDAEELYNGDNYNDEETITAPVEDTETNVDEEVDDTLYIDTTVFFNLKEISPDSIAAWKRLKAFAYVKKMDSLLKAEQEINKYKPEPRKKSSGSNFFDNFLSSSGLQYFLWVLAILFILFVVYKLFVTQGAFKRKSTIAKNLAPEIEEEIVTAESDFEKLIKQAIQSGNYRLAVRYLYLQTLHQLADKNIIELASDKTNHHYIREISNAEKQSGFASLTLNYEYVWYGDFAVDENNFNKIQTGFKNFNNTI